MNKKKLAFSIALIALALFGTIRIYYNLTDDFHLGNITFPLEKRPEWEFPANPRGFEEVKTVLDQKFSYIGKGAQSYVFGSEDGNYVIKFFKFKHLKPSFLISLLPPIGPLDDIKTHNQNRKKRKLEGVFEGHLIAFKYNEDNSGVQFLHFNPTPGLNLKTHLIDKLGFERKIDLDPIVFVLQKRGDTLRAAFDQLFKQGNGELAAFRAKQVLDMYVEEYSRHVWDRDHGISHNIGFIQDSPFHLDVGKLSYTDEPQDPEFYKNDLRHVARKINLWVEENYPSEAGSFKNEVERHLEYLLAAF
jgi:hypothetical protein